MEPLALASTPRGSQVKELVEQRLRQALDEDGAKITVDWRGAPRHLRIISMPVDMLYFNPETHRIRAQRTLDPHRNALLDTEPWGEASQAYLHHLLSRQPSNPNQIDPDYVALKEELDAFGQKDPGIITPQGILVDGNTRCAALREMGELEIRVGVLPADASWRDINSVELALQLRRDKRRDYSYINRLIAVEEELKSGRRPEDVARDFNIKIKTLNQDRWVYGLINDAIRRSAVSDGSQLRLVDFEDHQEKLRELHRDFLKLSKIDPDAAEQLKETRLAMVILNYPKTTVRLAEQDFYNRYLAERLPEDLKGECVPASSGAVIPGLKANMPASSREKSATRSLTDRLLQASAQQKNGDKLDAQTLAKASSVVTSARETFDVATKLASTNVQFQKRQIAVSERLTDAADYVNQCVAEFAEAKSKRALDEDAFDDALLTLRASLAKLARQAARAFAEPSDGVQWLVDSTRNGETLDG
jgi:hypothetical protein